MKKLTLISVTLLTLATSFAAARDGTSLAVVHDRDDHRCHDSRWCVSAPEIDPAQAMGALALLGGTIAIVRGYRRRKK